MAALVFMLSCVGEQICKISFIFFQTRSFVDTFNIISKQRQDYLVEKYIKETFTENKNNNIYSKVSESSFDEVDFNFPSFKRNKTKKEPHTIMGDPDVIFKSEYLNEIQPGTSFYVNGTILKTCERFSINLVLDTPTKDFALHFNPRLPQNYIVRNSHINGSWGDEEVTSALQFSLHRGEKFSVQILITETDFLISINEKHFASFRHRLPYNKIDYLTVKGDVMDIEFLQKIITDYPTTNILPENLPIINNKEQIILYSEKENFKEMPYYGQLTEKLKNGYRIHINGRVKILPHSFYVNLQQGSKIWPHPLIPLHLNPRFANIGGRHIICRNSWFDNKWDREERSETNTDFLPGNEFNLTIQQCCDSYHVYLNDKFIAEYLFKIEPNIVDTIYIQGDIHLKYVIMEKSSTEFDHNNHFEIINNYEIEE